MGGLCCACSPEEVHPVDATVEHPEAENPPAEQQGADHSPLRERLNKDLKIQVFPLFVSLLFWFSFSRAFLGSTPDLPQPRRGPSWNSDWRKRAPLQILLSPVPDVLPDRLEDYVLQKSDL